MKWILYSLTKRGT